MCASYGLGGSSGPLPDGLEPMSDQANQVLLNEWAKQRGNTAKITGKNALNLNPLIHAFSGERELELAWWWLWLDGHGPFKFSAFNSRDDKLLGRSWKTPFQHRAILPATWYVEKSKQFGLPDGEIFGIAALTSTVKRENGDELLTYSMVTRQAVGEAASVHDRMPLILPRDMHDEWLNPDRPGDQTLVDDVRIGSDEISRAMTTKNPRHSLIE